MNHTRAAQLKLALAARDVECVHVASPFKGDAHDLHCFAKAVKEKRQSLSAKL
jgi:hypothetical protein